MTRHALTLLLGAVLGTAGLSLLARGPAAADEGKKAEPAQEKKAAPVYEYGRVLVQEVFNDDGDFVQTNHFGWHGPDGSDFETETAGEMIMRLGGPQKESNHAVDVLTYLGSKGWRLVAAYPDRGPGKDKHTHNLTTRYLLARP
jgi:hypothetical protein